MEVGHAYCTSGFVVKYGGTMAAIEYGNGFFFSSRISAVYVDYINQKLKGEIVDAGIITFFGETIVSLLAVVVVGGKAPLQYACSNWIGVIKWKTCFWENSIGKIRRLCFGDYD